MKDLIKYIKSKQGGKMNADYKQGIEDCIELIGMYESEQLNMHIVSRSKPKEEKQILDSEKKCKGDTIKDYYIIDEETLRNLTQSIEDKTIG